MTSCPYAPQSRGFASLGPAELKDLHKRYSLRKTKRIGEQLFQHHYGFAVRVAMRYVRPEFPADEAISAAVRGLLNALRRYDPSRGAFTTFSYWWIFKAIAEDKALAVELVRLPIGIIRKSRRAQRLRLQLGSDDLEIARQLGVDVDELEHLEELHMRPRTTPIDADHDTMDQSPNPREALEAKETPSERECMQEEIAEGLQQLSERERFIVEQRFLEEAPTFAQLGRKLGLSDEAVRKIFLQAMTKLKEYCGGAN